jgi:penicillin amidase
MFFFVKKVSYDGVIRADTAGEIRITRDRAGIPRVTASNASDAFFALGYLHAKDRLYLIEYYRAVASGTLSSIIGSSGVGMDRLSLLIGFARDARELVSRLEAPYSDYLRSYVRGINFYKHHEMGALIDIPNLPVTDWTAEDVVSLLLLFDWFDSFRSNVEQVFLIPPSENSARIRRLLPDNLTFYYTEQDKSNVLLIKEIRNTLVDFVGPFLSGYAFFLPSAMTNDGRAISAFSYDSGLEAFPRWYPVSLNISGSEISGVTANGLPFFFAGKTRAMDFSCFHIAADTQDYYREKVRTESGKTQFFNAGRWKDFEQKTATITINERGQDPRTLPVTLRFRDGWPVVSDMFADTINPDVISLTYLRADVSEIAAKFAYPFSDTIGAAVKSIQKMKCPPKVFLFSSEGAATAAYAGQIPSRDIRRGIIFDGERGSNPGLIELGRFTVDSRRDTLIAGSSMFDREPAPLRQFIHHRDRARQETLQQALSSVSSLVGPREVKNLLRNTVSSIARTTAPVFYSILDRVPIPSARLCRIYFKNWDFSMDRNSIPAALNQVILRTMIEETVKDELRDDLFSVMEYHYLLTDNFAKILSDDSDVFFDDIETPDAVENRSAIFDRAFLKSLKYLNTRRGPYMEKWKWGNFHRGAFEIPFLKEKSYFQRSFFTKTSYRVSGDDSTLWRGSVRYNRDYRCGKITGIAGTCLQNGVHIAPAMGISMNPLSEFARSRISDIQFFELGREQEKYSLVIKPLNAKQ